MTSPFRIKVGLMCFAIVLPLTLLTSCGASSPKEKSIEFSISFDTSDQALKKLYTFPKLGQYDFACIPQGKKRNEDIGGGWISGYAKSIYDVAWSNSTIEMFDGAKKLIGVPDSFKVNMGVEGKCSVTFKFSRLNLPDEPIRLQSPQTSYGWDFPPSDWSDGYISGQDVGGHY